LKNELAALMELQSLDLEILEQSQELSKIPEDLEAMREDVTHVGEILQREKDRLAEAEGWRVEREKDMLTQNELLIKSKGKLLTARNEKENKAAQREIDTIRKMIQEREEETLKLMEAIDQYRGGIDKHTSAFGELEQELASRESEGQARMDEIETSIAGTHTRRGELVAQVPQKIFRLYDRIHKRIGRSVVPAMEGHCTGCNMDITAQMYNELQRGDKIYQCPNCYRILVYKPVVDPDAVPEE
jgi:predicted  nucleic acid-binding Zn-ribbon protein